MDTSSNNNTLLSLKEAFRNIETKTSLYTILNLLPQLVCTFDQPNSALYFLNENRLLSLLGYEPADIKEWSNNMLNLIYHEDLVPVTEDILKVYALPDDTAYHSFNCRVNHKSGKYKHVEICGAVLNRDAQGKSVSFLFVIADNTEKVYLEKKVQSLQFRLNDTEDLLEFGSWIWKIKTDKLYWSEGMYKILGYSKEATQSELSIEFYYKHIPAKDIVDVRRKLNLAIKNKTNFEYRYNVLTSSNQHKVVLTKGRVHLLPDGTVDRLSGITCDITNLTKTNSDLLSYKEMITEREYFLNQGSWETNLQTGETSWSRGMYFIFGYETDKQIYDTQVTNVLHLSHLSDEEVERSKEDWKRVLKEQDNYVREAPIITADGKHKYVETYGKIIRNKDGIAEKVIGTTRDITSLQEYKNNLEDKINELNRHNTELEGFTYIASHDLQEPLRKLTAFSERLQIKFKQQLGEEGQMYLDRILASTKNMRTLIDNLLEFSRTARSDKHFSKQDMTELLKEARSDMELKIEESEALIHTSPLPVMEVIPSQIKQLFNNLLNNSIKFKIADRRPVITIDCEKLSNPEKNSHNLRNSKEYYKLSVTDNGIGFEREYADRIFQIFQRLHGKNEFPGSGIGLAICKKIVENHHGIIYADAEINSGSVFTVILPENQS